MRLTWLSFRIKKDSLIENAVEKECFRMLDVNDNVYSEIHETTLAPTDRNYFSFSHLVSDR